MAGTSPFGSILDVDLSRRAARRRPTPPELLRTFLGGRALGARLLWDLPAGTPAEDPATPLVFAPGLLAAYPTPGTPRCACVTKSAMTRPLEPASPGASSLAYSGVGGSFGPELKYAGLDALVVRGRAASPTLLVVDGEEVRFEDARELWGLTSSRTDRALKERLGDGFQTAYLGPAGEIGVRFASIMHDVSRAFSRGGVGCVMGAKRLEAVAVRGRRMPGVEDDPAYREAVDALRAHFAAGRESATYVNRSRYGSLRSFQGLGAREGFSVRNFGRGNWTDMLDYHERAARHFVHSHSCFGCPVACRKSSVVREGPHAGPYRDTAHFEHAAMLGSGCGIVDEVTVARLGEACNEQGLDVISLGNLLGFLIDASSRRRLPEGFLEGLELGWGDGDALLDLVHRIAARRGVGDLLSRGVAAVAEALGPSVEPFAYHVKGLELAGWNPKGFHEAALSYATSTRGACHLAGHTVPGQDRQALADSIGVCFFVRSLTSFEILARLVTAVLGAPFDEEAMLVVGARALTLEKCFNGREGFGRRDDRALPSGLFREPMPDGGALPEPWLDRALGAYYRQRGWDPETSLPTDATLERLGLGFARVPA